MTAKPAAKTTPAAKKATPAKATPAKATAAKAAAPAPAAEKKPRTLAVTEGSQKCRVCKEAKPVTAFPTKAPNKAGEVLRDDRCRKCRDAAKAAAKKAPAKGKKA